MRGEGRGADREAEQQAAAVAHEDRRGMKVVDQEAAGRADQDHQQPHFRGRTDIDRGGLQQAERQRGRRDQRDAGTQPVHVVEQVEGVGQAHHPDQGAGHVQGHRLEPVEPVIEEQQHRRQRDLRDQLGRRLQRDDIVDQSDAEHQQRTDHQDRDLGGGVADQRHHQQRQPNADAAEQRHRTTMPAILARFGNVAIPDRGGAAQRDHGR